MLNTNMLCAGCMTDNGGEKVCSICGYDSRTQNSEDCLPVRTWLKNKFLLGRVIERNGEGITYIGWDNESDTVINVREYFPEGIAERANDMSVSITQGNEFTFNEGIMNFLELNRKLATLANLPALMPVVDVFESNGTAYSVSKAVQGITLREFLIRNGGSLSVEQARPLFMPLINTVAALHESGILHRGISPETVIVGRDGKLRLTGICIRQIRMSKNSMVAQLYPGFSAIEQYGGDLELRDGRYTDVYGLAATLFRVIIGAAPPSASERIKGDNLQIPAKYAESLPKYLLTTLASGLQLMPQNRVQDVDSFRIMLTPVAGENTVPFTAAQIKGATVSSNSESEKAIEQPAEQKNAGAGKYVVISAAITLAVCIVLGALIYFILNGNPFAKGKDEGNTSASSSNILPPASDIEKDQSGTTEKRYQVPDFAGVKYADVADNIDYNLIFEFVVAGKEFSSKYPKGYVIRQNVKPDETVQKGTTIELIVSLGEQQVDLPDVSGLSKDAAILELLKAGFIYDNIEFVDVYDSARHPGVVLETEPAADTRVETDIRVVVRYNTYDGTDISGTEPQ